MGENEEVILYCNGVFNLPKVDYNLKKLNEIAGSIKRPHFNDVKLVYDKNKQLHWYNKNKKEWYEEYFKYKKEKEALDVYDFAIKIKYQNLKGSILLSDAFCNVDFQLADIIINNLKLLLGNKIIIKPATKSLNNIKIIQKNQIVNYKEMTMDEQFNIYKKEVGQFKTLKSMKDCKPYYNIETGNYNFTDDVILNFDFIVPFCKVYGKSLKAKLLQAQEICFKNEIFAEDIMCKIITANTVIVSNTLVYEEIGVSTIRTTNAIDICQNNYNPVKLIKFTK